jgi:hypothetical protein
MTVYLLGTTLGVRSRLDGFQLRYPGTATKPPCLDLTPKFWNGNETAMSRPGPSSVDLYGFCINVEEKWYLPYI